MLLWLCCGGGGVVCTGWANGKGLRCRLCSRKTSEPAEVEVERARWRGCEDGAALAGWLARITNHPTISHITMATTLDRRTPIDLFTITSIYILRS